MIRSESYHPSLYKPYLVYINRGLVVLLDSFSSSFSIYSCFDLYKLYLSFFDHRTTSHLTFPVTASLDCGGGVIFPKNGGKYTRHEDGLSFTNDLELLDARITLAGLNPCGKVKSGPQVILGRIVDLPFFDDDEGRAVPRWH